MANKHDSFESQILERLSRGVLKTQISRELNAMGCASTPDQLARWLTRRAARITSRMSVINPVAPTALNPSLPPQSAKKTAPLDFLKRGVFDFDVPTADEIEAERAAKAKIKF